MLGLILSAMGVATLVWTVLLSLRLKFLSKPASAWFVAVVLSCISVASIVARVGSWVLPKSTAETVTCRLANVAFKVSLLLNPHINIRGVNGLEWEKLPKRAIVLINHTSWMDSVVFTACVPYSYINHFRTLLKNALLSIPLAGFLFKTAGHFPVFFSKDADNSWSIDKVRQAPVNERLLAFMKSDNAYLSFYPEGAVNKDARTLMSFRRGSFQYPIDLDIPVYAFLAVGNDEVWKPDGVPGLAADVDVKLFKVCDQVSSLDAKMLDATVLSEFCRESMQQVCVIPPPSSFGPLFSFLVYCRSK